MFVKYNVYGEDSVEYYNKHGISIQIYKVLGIYMAFTTIKNPSWRSNCIHNKDCNKGCEYLVNLHTNDFQLAKSKAKKVIATQLKTLSDHLLETANEFSNLD